MAKDRLPHIPKLCRRKNDRRYFATDPHTKKQVYFGTDAAKAMEQYEDWRRSFLERLKQAKAAMPDEPVKVIPGQRLTVAKLCELYLDHAAQWYRKDGEITSEVGIIQMMIRRFNAIAGAKLVNRLRVADVEAMQQQMVDDGLARRTCNALLHRLRAMAKWAVRKEVMSGDTLQRILSVPALRRGRTNAKEKPPVRAVELERVEATLPHLHEAYQAMVRAQLYAAMRPGEVCGLRADEIDRSREPWEYVPSKYKTQHHHEEDDPRRRRIFFGPQARAALLPWLERCQDPAKPLFRGPNGGSVNIKSYYFAIRYACKKGGIVRWHPNQLRHAQATAIRRKFGIEAAQDYLGHDDPNTTLTYAERSHERSRKIAEEMG